MPATGATSPYVDRAAEVSGAAREQRATRRRVPARRDIRAHTEARSSQPAHGATVSAQLEEMLGRFAAGECDETERAEVKKLLLQRSDLLPLLVAKLRTPSAPLA